MKTMLLLFALGFEMLNAQPRLKIEATRTLPPPEPHITMEKNGNDTIFTDEAGHKLRVANLVEAPRVTIRSEASMVNGAWRYTYWFTPDKVVTSFRFDRSLEYPIVET